MSHPLRNVCGVKERQCSQCERIFQPSSRHRKCPACRDRDTCTCGNGKQAKSATCGRCRSEVGGKNKNWKGGRSRHKAGYVLRHAPDHPRAKANSRYVFEHILVMEEMLGRYLVPGESVHHLNGVKDDNRPDNLELWTRPQPTGIRVSDAVAWARKIYELYVMESPPTMLTNTPEHSWRWRESNPRPSAHCQGFSERSRCENCREGAAQRHGAPSVSS
jgi:hypothetical protein